MWFSPLRKKKQKHPEPSLPQQLSEKAFSKDETNETKKNAHKTLK